MTTPSDNHAITFPAHVFASIAPSTFLSKHLTAPAPHLRPNSRSPSTARRPAISTTSLSPCNGGSVVRLGNTAVVCGVRAEILRREDVPNPPPMPVEDNDNGSGDDDDDSANSDAAELDRLGLLVPNVELATGCAPPFLPGNPPTAFAQTLAQRVRDLLYTSNMVRANDLRIWRSVAVDDDDAEDEDSEGGVQLGTSTARTEKMEVVAYWTLYIDVLFISLDGAAFDAAWGSVLAALRDTRWPGAWWDSERESVVCSDDVERMKGLRLRGLPVAVSFAVFADEDRKQTWVLADPDGLEEEVCREKVCVVLDRSRGKTRIKRIEKSGGSLLGRSGLSEVVGISERRWDEWKTVMEQA